MKQIPLLMIENMVSMALDDIKTQTRRVFKEFGDSKFKAKMKALCLQIGVRKAYLPYTLKGPYGGPGDRLWIKETHYRFGKWIKNGLSETGRQKWTFKPLSKEVKRFDDAPDKTIKGRGKGWHKRPSIFMPKWASHLTLEIVSIRFERLKDITIDDIDAEGFMPCSEMYRATEGNREQHKQDFGNFWDSINAEREGGAYAWINNPWVWVIEFRRLKK